MTIKYEQKILCIINASTSMAFSMIGPLYPPMALSKGISVEISGIVIGIFSLAQLFMSIFSTSIIKKYGRKNLYFYFIILNSICSFLYSILIFINNIFLFLFMSFLIRFIHGFVGCGLAIISISITTIINNEKELIEATSYLEFFWGLGFALGPPIISLFYYIGGYTLPFIVFGLIFLGALYFEKQLSFDTIINDSYNDENDNDNISIFSILNNFNIKFFIFVCIVQLNCDNFYTPTLSNYLSNRYSLSISKSSLFFMLTTVSYTISTLKINQISTFFGNHLCIFIGLFFSFIGCFFVAPFKYLPQSYWTIVIGLIIIGFQNALVYVPIYIELNKSVNNIIWNQKLSADFTGSIYNLSFNIGDLINPIISGIITNNSCFQYSAYYTGFLALFTSIIFWKYNYKIILEYWNNDDKNIKELKEIIFN